MLLLHKVVNLYSQYVNGVVINHGTGPNLMVTYGEQHMILLIHGVVCYQYMNKTLF